MENLQLSQQNLPDKISNTAGVMAHTPSHILVCRLRIEAEMNIVIYC